MDNGVYMYVLAMSNVNILSEGHWAAVPED